MVVEELFHDGGEGLNIGAVPRELAARINPLIAGDSTHSTISSVAEALDKLSQLMLQKSICDETAEGFYYPVQMAVGALNWEQENKALEARRSIAARQKTHNAA